MIWNASWNIRNMQRWGLYILVFSLWGCNCNLNSSSSGIGSSGGETTQVGPITLAPGKPVMKMKDPVELYVHFGQASGATLTHQEGVENNIDYFFIRAGGSENTEFTVTGTIKGVDKQAIITQAFPFAPSYATSVHKIPEEGAKADESQAKEEKQVEESQTQTEGEESNVEPSNESTEHATAEEPKAEEKNDPQTEDEKKQEEPAIESNVMANQMAFTFTSKGATSDVGGVLWNSNASCFEIDAKVDGTTLSPTHVYAGSSSINPLALPFVVCRP